MAQRIVTFKDLVDAISEDIGVQSTDTTARNKIKRFINMIYTDEVATFKSWDWLKKSTTVVHRAYYNVGTVSVTPNTTTITLSTAPNTSEGSFLGYRFSVDGNNQVYTVAAHTAGSATLTLTSEYQEILNATAHYKIWRDRVDLPTEAKETIEIWHSQHTTPLRAAGSQGFRKLEAALPKAEGFPDRYHTGNFYDPSPSDDETESDRYRQTLLWPSITTVPVTLNIDFIQEVIELEDDVDEPLMPVEDRIVLFYGAAAMAWSAIARNVEESQLRESKYQQKLARMAGDREDGMDTPALSPKSDYLNKIRRSGLRRREASMAALGGTSSVALPSYLKDVVIDGATIRANVLVSDDVTIDGRDISEDGTLLDSLANPTVVTLTDNTANQIAVSVAVTVDDVMHVQYSISRDSAIQAGILTVVTDGTNASISQGAIAEIGDVGVTFIANIASGNLRIVSTTTSTGSDAIFKYRLFKWLS